MSSSRIASMLPAAAPADADARVDRWDGFGLRGVKSAGGGVVVAVCLWALMGHSFAETLVYSLCISVSCWLFIDTGRGVIATWRQTAPSSGPWPGWLWMAGIVGIGAVLGYAIGNEIGNWLLDKSLPGPFNASWRQTLSLLVIALVPAVTITYFFQSRAVMAAQRTEVERAQRQAAEQQLMLLESQLEPHMLFNTLANLRALIGVDAARAQSMLDHLIAFLRASLAGSRERVHPLGDEFARLADYLALMQIRMGPRLQTSFELPPELAAASVPPLLLQPLVENCIKHGLEPKVTGGRISVQARRDGDVLVVTVRDDGIGSSGRGGGVTAGGGDGAVASSALDAASFGLAHVRERLATLYGPAASFDLAPAPDGEDGTVATVRLPLAVPPTASAGKRP